MANRPYDIWAQIKFLDGGKALGGTFEAFKRETDLPAQSSDTDDYARRLDTIHERIAQFTVRETKETAGVQLPDKTIIAYQVELPAWQREKYTAYRDELAYEFEREGVTETDDVTNILKRLLRLVQCASNPGLIDACYDQAPGKYPHLFEMCQELTQDSKLIVWSRVRRKRRLVGQQTGRVRHGPSPWTAAH